MKKRYDGEHVHISVDTDTHGRHAYFVIERTIPPEDDEPDYERPYGFHGGWALRSCGENEIVEEALAKDSPELVEIIDTITGFIEFAFDRETKNNITLTETFFAKRLEDFLDNKYRQETRRLQHNGDTYFLNFYLGFGDDSEWRNIRERIHGKKSR